MRCLYCDKQIKYRTIYSLLYEEDLLCDDCRSKMKYNHQKFVIDGVKVESFYEYDSLFKDILLQYKECYDEALKDVFLYKIGDYLTLRFIGYKILYVPSSSAKLNERGFNHLKKIYEPLNLKEVGGLSMINDTCQVGKSSKERLKMATNYKYQGDKINKLLIVDDVLTTGSSIKGVISAMTPYCKKIKVIVLAKT